MLMISLHIPAIAKVIEGGTAPEIFRRLRTHCYLSMSALWNREHVIAVIIQSIDDYPRDPDEIVLGRELSRDVIGALEREGYINILGRTWGRIGRRR